MIACLILGLWLAHCCYVLTRRRQSDLGAELWSWFATVILSLALIAAYYGLDLDKRQQAKVTRIEVGAGGGGVPVGSSQRGG
jgi:hypothetical protein